METLDAIAARRNVRQFQERPIAPHDLERILDAGRRTPSARNEQPWDLIVVEDRDRLQRLAAVWRGAGHVARAAAAVCLVVAATDDRHTREVLQYDLGQLTMAIMIAAADLGIGTAHAGVVDHAVAVEVLEIPEGREVAWIISMGYPADRPLRPIRRPDRRSLEDLIHRETW